MAGSGTLSLSIPHILLGAQGTLNTLVGLYGIAALPSWKAGLADKFGGVISTPAAYTSSIQLIYMGLFTWLATIHPRLHRPALLIRVLTHLLAGALFWGEGEKMRSTALVEMGFAVVNGLGMFFVREREEERAKTS